MQGTSRKAGIFLAALVFIPALVSGTAHAAVDAQYQAYLSEQVTQRANDDYTKRSKVIQYPVSAQQTAPKSLMDQLADQLGVSASPAYSDIFKPLATAAGSSLTQVMQNVTKLMGGFNPLAGFPGSLVKISSVPSSCTVASASPVSPPAAAPIAGENGKILAHPIVMATPIAGEAGGGDTMGEEKIYRDASDYNASPIDAPANKPFPSPSEVQGCKATDDRACQ
ncbi:MAG TPA: hypothetical protein VHB73_06535 [Alphaproteobacteria bacterium]|nr:hypothetical protein [Alphaproteobacteria bacterium]